MSGRRVAVIAVILAAAGAGLAPLPPASVEFLYSRHVYLTLQRSVTAASNVVPFAVTDLLLGAGAVAAAVLVRLAWRVRKRRGRWAAAAGAVTGLAAVAATTYLVFLVMWGLNYRRVPLAARLDYDGARVTPASVGQLGHRLAARLNALHGPAHAGTWPEWRDLPRWLGPSFAAVQRQLAPVTPALAGIPKRSALSVYFERAGVSGMTNPFALEVLVDQSHLPVERPFVAAHEWAHLAGYADESEANFLAWLVCFQGPPAAEYSGGLVLFRYVAGAMGGEERAALVGELEPGPRQDLRRIAARADRVWPCLQRPAWWVYDRYLRANRVEQGVRSYGLALQLIAGTTFEAPWVPAARKR